MGLLIQTSLLVSGFSAGGPLGVCVHLCLPPALSGCPVQTVPMGTERVCCAWHCPLVLLASNLAQTLPTPPEDSVHIQTVSALIPSRIDVYRTNSPCWPPLTFPAFCHGSSLTPPGAPAVPRKPPTFLPPRLGTDVCLNALSVSAVSTFRPSGPLPLPRGNEPARRLLLFQTEQGLFWASFPGQGPSTVA